jgi:hypothetical protein
VGNSVLYTQLEPLLKFIERLPTGSVLDHDAGCVVPVSYKLGEETITVEAFKALCVQSGVELRIYGSW